MMIIGVLFSIINFLLVMALQLEVGSALSFIEEEEYEIGFKQTINVHDKVLVEKESEYQQIYLYESDHYGKVFVLDESLQVTERDASHYNFELDKDAIDVSQKHKTVQNKRLNICVLENFELHISLCS